MKKLLFWIAYPLLWGISKLPYRLFYAFSDFVFLLVFYIIGYRKKVVQHNLKLAFPEKSIGEIKQIRKKFYHHFCDIFLEMIKTLGISERELKKRFVLKNPEELKRLESLEKSCVIMLGHYSSYEWVISLQLQGMTYKAYGIYKKIKNEYFDKLIHDSRGKFGLYLIDKNEVTDQMLRDKVSGMRAFYGMISDQSPRLKKLNYWLDFLGHEVPVFVGSEKMAKKLDFSMTYLKIEKVKRGYYEAEFVPLSDNPGEGEGFQFTEKYFDLLEAQIRQKPEYYLWTHRRFKHARN